MSRLRERRIGGLRSPDRPSFRLRASVRKVIKLPMNSQLQSPFIVRVGSDQHIGSRESQEDSIGISDFLNLRFVPHGGVLGVLADGMGGASSGKKASETAVQTFVEHYAAKLPGESIRDALMRSLFAANDAVHEIPNREGPERKAGTTFVAAVIHKRDLHWISVGDSRAYLARGNSITQLTIDHTYSTELDRRVHQKLLTADEAAKHPDRDVLTSFVGHGELSDIDCNIKPLALETNDFILLCTDGLYRSLSAEEILETLKGHPQRISESLIAQTIAKKVPGQDNVSAVVLYCDEDGGDVNRENIETTNKSEFRSTSRFIGTLIISLALIGLGLVLASLQR